MPRKFGKKKNLDRDLFEAARRGDVSLVRILLNVDPLLRLTNPIPDVNYVDSKTGLTALHFAAAYGNEEMLKLLVAHGADVAAHDLKGRGIEDFRQIFRNKPLHKTSGLLEFAIIEDDKLAFDTALEMGVDLNSKNEHDETPLMCAVLHNRNAMAKRLVDMGANLEEVNSWFDSALHLSASYDTLDIAIYLVVAGAKLDRFKEGLFDMFDLISFAIADCKDEEKKMCIRRYFQYISEKKYPGISATEIAQKEDFHVARILSLMSYSELDYEGFPSAYDFRNIFLRAIEDIDITRERKEQVRQVAKAIDSENFITAADGRRFKIVKSCLKNHASYFMIELDRTLKPTAVYYVDGGRFDPSDYSHPLVTKFEFEGKRAFTLSKLESQLLEVTKIDSDDKSQWFKHLGLKPVADLIPGQQQKHDNCELKSIMALIRLVDQVVYGHQIELVDGKPCGEGFERHKELKDEIILSQVKKMAHIAKEATCQPFAQEVRDFLQQVILPNAVRKTKDGNEDRAKKLGRDVLEILRSECGIAPQVNPKSPAFASATPALRVVQAATTAQSSAIQAF